MAYDVIVVGAGPGGLACAVQVARSYRRVCVFDRGGQRAYWIPKLCNYLGFPDGISGKELLALSQKQAVDFGVKIVKGEVAHVEKVVHGFRVLAKGKEYVARRLVLATGVMDLQPDIDNVYDFAGKTLYYCLDCDGYEFGKKKAAVFGHEVGAALSACRLVRYAAEVVIITNGQGPRWEKEQEQLLQERGVRVYQKKVTKLLGDYGRMTGVLFQDGTQVVAEVGVSVYGVQVHNQLALDLGIKTLPNGHIVVDSSMETSLKHVYGVGDVANSSQMVSLAVAGGVRAAVMIEKSFLLEEFGG